MSRKYFFDFRSPDLTFDIRFWTLGFLLVMRSRRAGLPLQCELGSGSSAFRGTYQGWLGPKIVKKLSKVFKFFLGQQFFKTKFKSFLQDKNFKSFSSQKFYKFSWKPIFSSFHATLIIMNKKYFSGPSLREFFLKINEIPDWYPAKPFLNYLL